MPSINESYGHEPTPDARIEGTKPLTPEQQETASKIARPASSAGGAVAGAAAGTVTLGPLGTLIGAIAGALGGWWAGSAATHTEYSEDDERYFREHFDSHGTRAADARFDASLPAYQLGHIAAHNPGYAARSFDEIEPELSRAWSGELARQHGAWGAAREYARAGYERRRLGIMPPSPIATEMGGTASHRRAEYSDPQPPADDV